MKEEKKKLWIRGGWSNVRIFFDLFVDFLIAIQMR